jgi:thiamine pyrophosphate-dependent acetolactate synthase large subunit-like protein
MSDLHAEVGQALAEAGAKRAFTVPSAHNLDFLDALQAAQIEVIASRCELAAGHMADGHARRSGQPTVLVTSTGPGAGNAVGAFATAAKDCSPLIHATTSNEHSGGQTVHRVKEQVGWHQAFGAPLIDLGDSDVQELRRVLKRQTGPVTVVVPYRSDRRGALDSRPGATIGDARADGPDDVTAAVGVGLSPWLASDRRMLWIGGGARVVGPDALVHIAEVSGAAVLTTIQAKDLFPYDHPQFVGCTLQSAVSRSIARSAGVCLALGSRLTETSTAAWTRDFPPLLLRVDTDRGAGPVWPGVEVDLIGSDIAETCDAVRVALATEAAPSFGREAGRTANLERSRKDRTAPEYVLLDGITSHLSEGDTFVCDTTMMAFWAIGGSQLPVGSRFLFPGLLSMGFGVPAGVGASWARSDAHTIVLTGDGSLLSVLPVLEDATRAPGRLSILVMDDDGYGILRPRASESVARDLCTFRGPDWRTLAASFGLTYEEVGDPRNVATALDHHPGGACLFRIDGTGLSMAGWVEA